MAKQECPVLAAEHHQKGSKANMLVKALWELHIFETPKGTREHPKMHPGRIARRLPGGGLQEAYTKHEWPVPAAVHHHRGTEVNRVL